LLNKTCPSCSITKEKTRIVDGKAPIYVRVTIDRLDDEISTGIYVHSDHWENDTRTISGCDAAFKNLNKELRQWKLSWKGILSDYRLLMRWLPLPLFSRHTEHH
jgi:hypothetical protein